MILHILLSTLAIYHAAMDVQNKIRIVESIVITKLNNTDFKNVYKLFLSFKVF